jgi:Double-stranded DNA deaminase toxin A
MTGEFLQTGWSQRPATWADWMLDTLSGRSPFLPPLRSTSSDGSAPAWPQAPTPFDTSGGLLGNVGQAKDGWDVARSGWLGSALASGRGGGLFGQLARPEDDLSHDPWTATSRPTAWNAPMRPIPYAATLAFAPLPQTGNWAPTAVGLRHAPIASGAQLPAPLALDSTLAPSISGPPSTSAADDDGRQSYDAMAAAPRPDSWGTSAPAVEYLDSARYWGNAPTLSAAHTRPPINGFYLSPVPPAPSWDEVPVHIADRAAPHVSQLQGPESWARSVPLLAHLDSGNYWGAGQASLVPPTPPFDARDRLAAAWLQSALSSGGNRGNLGLPSQPADAPWPQEASPATRGSSTPAISSAIALTLAPPPAPGGWNQSVEPEGGRQAGIAGKLWEEFKGRTIGGIARDAPKIARGVIDLPGHLASSTVDNFYGGLDAMRRGAGEVGSGNFFPNFPSSDARTWESGGALRAAGGAFRTLFSPIAAATEHLVENPVTQLTGNPEIGSRAGVVANAVGLRPFAARGAKVPPSAEPPRPAVAGDFPAATPRAAEVGRGQPGSNGRVAPELPEFVPGGKTSGVLWIPTGDVSLRSGVAGPASAVPKGSGGFDIVTRTHVEGHAAALMQQQGITEATLHINNPAVCPPCSKLLPRMLAPGSSLNVVLPNGEVVRFTGRVP